MTQSIGNWLKIFESYFSVFWNMSHWFQVCVFVSKFVTPTHHVCRMFVAMIYLPRVMNPTGNDVIVSRHNHVILIVTRFNGIPRLETGHLRFQSSHSPFEFDDVKSTHLGEYPLSSRQTRESWITGDQTLFDHKAFLVTFWYTSGVFLCTKTRSLPLEHQNGRTVLEIRQIIVEVHKK